MEIQNTYLQNILNNQIEWNKNNSFKELKRDINEIKTEIKIKNVQNVD